MNIRQRLKLVRMSPTASLSSHRNTSDASGLAILEGGCPQGQMSTALFSIISTSRNNLKGIRSTT